MKTAILIIWLAPGLAQTFDSQQFLDIDRCNAARATMAEAIERKWNWPERTAFEGGSVCVELEKTGQ